MKKILNWLSNNILLGISIFFLLFIPLYPKIPLFDITQTWVNIRIEDFLIAGALAIFGILLLFKRATLKTPLTPPLIAFWLIGLASTVYAIIFIFPNLTNVFPHLAAFHYLRHIEYLAVFFIGYNAIKGSKAVHIVTVTLVVVTLVAFFYGMGQKFWGFPAFLTGNEEFSKGIPLRLAEGARIPSTFAGHYDLSAFLVLVIPILLGVMFGVKKWWARIVLLGTSILGYSLLLLTASRVSFAAFLISLAVLLIFLKKKKLIIPTLIAALLFSFLFEGMVERFGKTISQVDLVVDARTGQAVGIAGGEGDDIVVEDKTPEGDELKTGTGYINLRGEGIKGRANEIIYKRTRIGGTGDEEDVTTIEGDFIIKRGFAYDVSFTTRFQGTWPRAINAYDRNPLLGSGYSTINLASDNNYLRMLGEIGALGLLSFVSIFVIFAIYVHRMLPQIKSIGTKVFVLGFSAGVVGLAFNAVLIDVFEASKVAFVLWFLMGLAVGMVRLHQKKKVSIATDLKRLLLSYPAIVLYIIVAAFSAFRINFENFFVADDFTWLRWADECETVVRNGARECESLLATVGRYLTSSEGFFYRPGTKLYFEFMYKFFSLDASKYHIVAATIHAVAGIGLFFVSLRFTKSKIAALLVALTWVTLSIHYEALFWISVTGHLVSFSAIILSLVFYMYAEKWKRIPFLVLSLVSAVIAPLFHEVGIIAPLLVIAYHMLFIGVRTKKSLMLIPFAILPPIYLVLRYISSSHWSGGDYSYNIEKLPLNTLGNALGYLSVSFGGPDVLPYYDIARSALKNNIPIALGIVAAALILLAVVVVLVRKSTAVSTQKVLLFAGAWFLLSLLPFLGLGNLSPRYAYLASFAPIFVMGFVIYQGMERLKGSIQKISFGTAVVATGIFMYFQVGQISQRGEDWEKASFITENFLIGFYDHYPEGTSFKNTRTLYFVDVPIKYRSAWVFPLGLENPMYFATGSDNFNIIQVDEVTEELQQKIESRVIELFIFNDQGLVEELIRQPTVILE